MLGRGCLGRGDWDGAMFHVPQVVLAVAGAAETGGG
jgi:hypothetical protein